MANFPQPVTDAIAFGTTADGIPYTVAEARQVLIAMVQSGAGLVRAKTQAGNAAELAAIALLTGDTTYDIGAWNAALFNEKLPPAALAATDEWGDVVSALAAA